VIVKITTTQQEGKKRRGMTRPYKPGYWWWEDDRGMFRAAEMDDDMGTIKVNCFWTVNRFEELPVFVRWIGPACPPKKIEAYSCGVGGKWIERNDVKEYMLDGVNEPDAPS